jgi:hypothetical protein
MPAVRTARRLFTQAQRRVAVFQKSIRLDQLSLAMAPPRKAAMALRTRLKASTTSLKQAKGGMQQVVKDLLHVLKEEAVKSRSLAQARAMAVYKAKLQSKSGYDLDRAVVKFAAAWKKKRNKAISRKLTARLRKEAAKSRIAVKRANAKARESVRRAELLAQTRARKAAAKARAKVRRLMAKAKSKARMAGKRAVTGKAVRGRAVRSKTRRASLAALSARKVVSHKRGK